MSTLKANAINNISASAGGIQIDSSGAISGALPSPNRNLLYNGAMQVAQRGTSTAGITTIGYYTADRWQHVVDALGTWTQDVQNDAPTGSGLRRSVRLLCTTADAAPAANDFFQLRQTLEGQDLQRIAKGTASAQQLTISFWVKSNVTGTYIVGLRDADNTRTVSRSYTISASATWEKKTITFPADTTGAFDNDNAGSLAVNFWLAAGSTFTSGTLATTWGAEVAANVAVGQTNLAAATNNYWQVTGVQLEVGDTATPFEFKSYGQELRECQRYYWRSTPGNAFGRYGLGGARSTTVSEALIHFPVTLRSIPSALEFSNLAIVLPGVGSFSISSMSMSNPSPSVVNVEIVNSNSGATYGDVIAIINNNNTAGYLAVSAEL